MLRSLNEQANNRKLYLASLREKRNIENEPIVEEINRQPNFEQSTDRNEQTNTAETEDTKSRISSRDVIRSRNFDMETREAVLGIKNPPTLTLSNHETVEVLASQIQREILQDISRNAENPSNPRDAEFCSDEKHESAYYNKDLKADLAYYLNKAESKTDQALNRILQDKYQNSIH